MTTAEMLVQLAAAVEDVPQKRFTAAGGMKLLALNDGQQRVVEAVDVKYLSALEVTSGAIDLTAGVFAINGVAVEGLVRGMDGIRRVKDSNTGLYATRRTPEDAEALTVNALLAPTKRNPSWYPFDDMGYVLPATITQVVVNYLKQPPAITVAASCVLSPSLHPIILKYAEAWLWRADNKGSRAGEAEAEADKRIAILNGVYTDKKEKR